MNFKIIAGILTVSCEGDFTAGMGPSLKKAFGRAETYFFFFFPVHFNASESDE